MYNVSFNLSNSSMMIRNFEMPLDIIFVGTISYALIFIVGIIGNFITIFVLTRKDFSNFTNYLLANLSVADSLTLLICIPTGLHDLYAKERWYFGRTMCYLILFIENCLGIASILSIFFVSIERYLVVCCPLRVKSIMSHSRTLKLIFLVWLTAIFVNLPLIFMSEIKETTFHDFTKGYKCIVNTDLKFGQWRQVYSFFVTFVVYLIIGVLLIFIYRQITIDLNRSTKALISPRNVCRKTSKEIEDLNEDNHLVKDKKTNYIRLSHEGQAIMFKTEKAETRLSINNNISKYVKPRLQVILILKVVIVVFYVSLFPLKIWNLIFMFFGHKHGFRQVIQLREFWYINISMRILFYVNSSINPIMFNCLSGKFRNSCRKIMQPSCGKKTHLDGNESNNCKMTILNSNKNEETNLFARV